MKFAILEWHMHYHERTLYEEIKIPRKIKSIFRGLGSAEHVQTLKAHRYDQSQSNAKSW